MTLFTGIELLGGELTAWPVGTGGIFPLLVSYWWLMTGGFTLIEVPAGYKRKKYCVLAELWHINTSITQTALSERSWGKIQSGKHCGRGKDLHLETKQYVRLQSENVKSLVDLFIRVLWLGVTYTICINVKLYHQPLHLPDMCQSASSPRGSSCQL